MSALLNGVYLHAYKSAPAAIIMASSEHVTADINQLVQHIQRIATSADGHAYSVTFGQLFKDDAVQNTLEVWLTCHYCTYCA